MLTCVICCTFPSLFIFFPLRESDSSPKCCIVSICAISCICSNGRSRVRLAYCCFLYFASCIVFITVCLSSVSLLFNCVILYSMLVGFLRVLTACWAILFYQLFLLSFHIGYIPIDLCLNWKLLVHVHVWLDVQVCRSELLIFGQLFVFVCYIVVTHVYIRDVFHGSGVDFRVGIFCVRPYFLHVS